MKNVRPKTRGFQKRLIMAMPCCLLTATCELPWAIDKCFDELGEGDVLIVTLGEQYDFHDESLPARPPPTCYESYGISVGTQLRLKVEGFSGTSGCIAAFGEIEGFSVSLPITRAQIVQSLASYNFQHQSIMSSGCSIVGACKAKPDYF